MKLYFLILAINICSLTTVNSQSINQELNRLKRENLKLKHQVDSLQKLALETVKEYKNTEGFWLFFREFMTDSEFQKKRIEFPLTYITWSENEFGDVDLGGEIDTIQIDKNNWTHDWFYINQASERTQVYDNFDLEFAPTSERVLHWFGVESGGDLKYYFKNKNNKWYLIKKVQLGD